MKTGWCLQLGSAPLITTGSCGFHFPCKGRYMWLLSAAVDKETDFPCEGLSLITTKMFFFFLHCFGPLRYVAMFSFRNAAALFLWAVRMICIYKSGLNDKRFTVSPMLSEPEMYSAVRTDSVIYIYRLNISLKAKDLNPFPVHELCYFRLAHLQTPHIWW